MTSEAGIQSLIERANAVYDSWEAGELVYEDALQELDKVIAEARQQQLTDALLAGLNNKVILLRDTGAFDLAFQINDEVFEMAHEQHNNRYLSYAAFNRGDMLRMQGKNEQARQAFREAYNFADEAPDYLAAAYALHSEGKMVMALQQADQALMLGEKGLAYIQQYVETSQQPDPIYTSLQSALNQLLARVAIANGDWEASWQRAQQALDFAQIRNSSLELGNTYCVLAELATHSEIFPDGFNNDFDIYYQTALIYYERAHAEAEMATAQLMYAQSLFANGRAEEAASLAETAGRSFKKLQRGADFLQASKLFITYRKAL
ncbi:MAG: tetratricopeptide repeat protein [Anaerolineae bacterium]|nr:tetratricopeptide repeat protein [Anaerolineae bacterium]